MPGSLRLILLQSSFSRRSQIGGEDPDLIELERAVGALLEARGLAPGDFMGSCPGNHALFWSGREGGPAAPAESEAVRAAEKN